MIFRGRLIAEVTGMEEKPWIKRWHDLRLYKTEHNRFVVEVVLTKRMKGEEGHNAAYLCEDMTAVKEALESHDFMQGVGFPKAEKWLPRIEKVRVKLEPEYRERCQQLLTGTIGT